MVQPKSTIPEVYGDPRNPSAIVIRREQSVQGIEFFSPPNFSQQLGLMSRPSGYRVPAHRHNVVERTINITQEVLLLRKGTSMVNLFSDEDKIEYTINLDVGDVVLLAHGGHEIVMTSDCEILEVKQGPYAGENDKTQLFPKIS